MPFLLYSSGPLRLSSPPTTSITQSITNRYSPSILYLQPKVQCCSPRYTLEALYWKDRYPASSLWPYIIYRHDRDRFVYSTSQFHNTYLVYDNVSVIRSGQVRPQTLQITLRMHKADMFPSSLSSSLHAPVHIISSVPVINTSSHTTIHPLTQKANRAVKTMRNYTRISSKRIMYKGKGNIDGGRQCTIRW